MRFALLVARAPIAIAVIAAGCAPARTAVTSASLAGAPFSSPARELTPDERAVHVLNRLAFGPRPGDVYEVRSMGVDTWIAQQLRPEAVADAAMTSDLARYQTIGKSAGDLLREYPLPGARQALKRMRGDSLITAADTAAVRRDARRNRAFAGELISARVARAVGSERQLQEVMTDFWLNHFSIFVGKGPMRYYLPDYEREAIRPHALGNFRDLLGAVAKSPAMLIYLDNAQSVADSGRPTLTTNGRGAAGRRLHPAAAGETGRALTPQQRQRLTQLQARRPRGINENYARELLELHTLGVDGGYTQEDIVQVARALTGWSVRAPRRGDGAFYFNEAAHDAGEKHVLGHRLAPGRGLQDGEEVLDILTRHRSTATFIARKLAVRLVGDTPPAALVERAAAAFRRTEGDIREVVRTIVTSPEFFARESFMSKVKSPFEVVVSAARALGGRPDSTAATAMMVARLGQPIYGHQAPNGWPETGSAWMNTGAILERINFGLTVAAGRLPGSRLRGWPEYDRLNKARLEEQVDGVIATLLGGRVSPDTRAILLSGENPLLDDLPDSSETYRRDEAVLDAVLSMAAKDSTDEAKRGGTSGMGGPPRGDDITDRVPLRNRMIAGGAQALRDQAVGAQPQLKGLAQVVGLALGSPEFQRR